MPEGLQTSLKAQEFADLVEFLVSRKQPANALTTHHGMPEVIPQLERSIELNPFLSKEFRLPPPPNEPARKKPKTGLIWFEQIPGFPQRFLVAHQAGVIWSIDKRAKDDGRRVFIDFSRETYSERGPNGLLGLTFHPKFRKNRKYYVKRQIFEAEKISTLLEERTTTADGMRDSGRTPRLLLKIAAVAEHHNGGCIQFGPDGFLYFGMGDSAPNFDPQGYGHDLGLLFGKMLRIDVDHQDDGLPYAIPADNPFRERPGARPEIWAYGFREPWRFSFDSATGELWVADLGQERGDELAIVHRGKNHGWNVYEGFELFSNGHRREGEVYTPPLFASRRRHGAAIMGGHVYHGDKGASFQGVYIFGDHRSKRIWGLTRDGASLKTIRQLGECPQSITAFAADEQGNLYVVGFEGMVYQLDFTGARFDGPVKAAEAPSAP